MSDNNGSRRRSRLLWALAIVAAAVVLIGGSLYLEVDDGGQASQAGGQEPPQVDTPDVQAMVKGLEEKLKANPQDGEGWLMLGRSYLTLDRPEDAVDALARAHELLGDKPNVLVTYARALATARQPRSLEGKPAELVDRALEQAPDNPEALWMSGMAAAERGDYETTVERWETLLAQTPEGSDNAKLIRRNLEQVRSRMDGDAGGAPAAASGGDASPGPALEVEVTLASELQEQASPDATVFIFARAVDGPPMPLAVVKRRVSELPVTVTLDDGDSMMAGRGISGHDQVTVMARVSNSGGVTAKPGDLETSPQTVPVGKDGTIALTVDSVVR